MIKFLNKLKLKLLLKKRFPNVIFGPNFNIEKKELIDNISFKGTAYVGSDANWSPKGKIEIGNNVIFGPRSIIWTYNHNYNSINYIPYGFQNEDIIKNVKINNNVWIGMNVIIMPGVEIEEGAIIAAGSVVTKNVKKGYIVGGNPAKEIGKRNEEVYEKLKLENKFYLEFKNVKN